LIGRKGTKKGQKKAGLIHTKVIAHGKWEGTSVNLVLT